MTQPPNEIRVLGRFIKIKSAELEGETDGEYSDGVVLYSEDEENPDNLRDTVLHELIHAYDNILLLKLKEEQVRRLAPCVLQLIRDNPEFVTWLQNRS